MKTVGMIGGMSWESTVEYYRLMNEAVKDRLGGLHSIKCLLYSVDFAEIEVLQRENRWQEGAELMTEAARRLEAGGADCILICTNTMHKSAPEVQAAVEIPFLHIADAAGAAVNMQGLHKVGLLGTNFTMEGDFYRGRLQQHFGLDVLIPSPQEREVVHRVIYDELCLGIIRPESRAAYCQIINTLVARGAEGIILGCTEIGLLVKPEDSAVPLFDTTRLHAFAAVDFALS